EAYLAPRVAAAKAGKISSKSVDEIFDEEIANAK
ncbi:MAG TPA: antitoxin, partial [Alteromonas sp.]|nr:antitoxin [Alteromonas sp.]